MLVSDSPSALRADEEAGLAQMYVSVIHAVIDLGSKP